MTDRTPLFVLPLHAEPCPLCQKSLVIKTGKSGPFLGCSDYPQCHYVRAFHQHDNTTVKVLEREVCPQCAAPLAVKNGRYGMFIGCTAYPDCGFVVHEEVVDAESICCPACHTGQLVERLSKYGKAFWGCNRYPDCSFLVNEQPTVGRCQFCDFGMLVQKRGLLYCAAKRCKRKQSATSLTDSEIE